MSTTMRTGFVTGSGAVLDVTSDAAISDTRIRAINYSGVGTFLITGTSADAEGNTNGSNIKFVGTTANDTGSIYLPDLGIRMPGSVMVSAPTSASTVTIFYG
tara:strand:+ start:569 stop:874 length:306 start_codon:yes stop_codon:yes gene_type:complete